MSQDNPNIFIKPENKDPNAFPMMGGPQRITSLDSRRKTPLSPGHSPMDWAKLKTSGTDLRQGLTQLQRFTEKDVAKHKSFL